MLLRFYLPAVVNDGERAINRNRFAEALYIMT